MERKEKRLANEKKRVEEQKQAIAVQHAELVELQAAVDSTATEIDATQRDIATLSTQIARIEADKVKLPEAVASPADSEQHAAARAQDCLSRTLAALQNYRGAIYANTGAPTTVR